MRELRGWSRWARTGSAYCSFDGTATVVGDFVVASSTASGGFYPLVPLRGSDATERNTSAGTSFAR